MAFFITLLINGKKIKKEYEKAVLLKDVIAENGIAFDMPCGGRGACGNCKVLAKGGISKPTQKEVYILGDDINNGIRLACDVKIFDDAEIEIPTSFVAENILNSNPSVTINPISGTEKCFACAVDVGTTTIAFRYVSLPDGTAVFSEHLPNPQRVRGADILTRIDYALNGGAKELRIMLENEIKSSALRFGKRVEFYILTGNTAMMHILSGKTTKGLATAPFKPETLFGFWEENRYYMRCASAYIGGDIIASLLKSGITESDTPAAMLDIGTNNECILWDGKRLYACSSPAGPTFEGGNISCGMAASGGAICRVEDKNGIPVVFTVEPNSKPRGFCGSGLIDAVAFLLKHGYIANDGSVVKDLPDFGGIKLSAEDISELQLAKSAVCAGLLTLCEKAKSSPKKIYLTGSFGNKINAANAEFIGMIPKGMADMFEASPCGALDGATEVLLSTSMMKITEQLAADINVIELADSDFFERAFIENLYF